MASMIGEMEGLIYKEEDNRSREEIINEAIRNFSDGEIVDFDPIGFVYAQLTAKEIRGEIKLHFQGYIDKRAERRAAAGKLHVEATDMGRSVNFVAGTIEELREKLKGLDIDNDEVFEDLHQEVLRFEKMCAGEKQKGIRYIGPERKIINLLEFEIKSEKGFEELDADNLSTTEKMLLIKRAEKYSLQRAKENTELFQKYTHVELMNALVFKLGINYFDVEWEKPEVATTGARLELGDTTTIMTF